VKSWKELVSDVELGFVTPGITSVKKLDTLADTLAVT
jgi:hypothetical protein